MNWWRRWFEARAERAMLRGYSWAAAEMLSGRRTPEEIEEFVFWQPNAHQFDDGVASAVVDWRLLHGRD